MIDALLQTQGSNSHWRMRLRFPRNSGRFRNGSIKPVNGERHDALHDGDTDNVDNDYKDPGENGGQSDSSAANM